MLLPFRTYLHTLYVTQLTISLLCCVQLRYKNSIPFRYVALKLSLRKLHSENVIFIRKNSPNKSTQPKSTSRLYRTIGHDTNSVSKEVVVVPLPVLEGQESSIM